MTIKHTNSSQLPPVLALVAVAAIWGLASPVIVWTLQYVPPFSFLFWRFLIATPLFIPLLWRNQAVRSLKKKDLLQLLPLSFLGITVAIGLIFVGFNHTTALDGSLIGILGPLLIIAGGGIFLREEITKREKIGLTIALIGSIVTLMQPLLEHGFAGTEAALGNFLIFASTAAWAAYALWDKHWQKKFPPLLIIAAGSVVSLAAFAPLAYLETRNFQFSIFNFQSIFNAQFTNALVGIIYMTLLSYILAYYLYEWGVRRIEVSEAAVFGYLQPVFAFPAAYILLGETPTRYFALGAVLIGIGVLLTEYKKKM
jgi:drug/metabolite transporter (DMT)-like permease